MATAPTFFPEKPPRPRREPIPPLESGDRLSREEFERRYDAMPHLKKAELIEGVVYVGSPVSQEFHSGPHYKLIVWSGVYTCATPGIEGGDNGSLRVGPESDPAKGNEPQPDAFLFVLPQYGGQARIDDEGYLMGAPEFIGEVSASSTNYDLHDKLRLYRRHQVREYMVWRTYDEQIDWFVTRGNDYERLPLTADGLFKSEVLPGLWLDPAALIRGDMARVMEVAQEGIASPEHAAFVAQLQEKAGRTASPKS